MHERPRLVALPTIMLLLVLAACTALAGPTPPVQSGPVSASADPSPGPSAPSTTEPPASAVPSDGPSAGAGTASPSATPDPSALELEAVGCNGGVVLDWSPSADPAFHHYTALRSRDPDIAPGYPPIAPAVDWGGTYTTDRFITTGVDASLIPTGQLWHYRVMAYDALNRVVSSSPVRSARMTPVEELGPVTASTRDETTRLSWAPYSGRSACFSSYRVLFGTAQPLQLLSAISEVEITELETDALHPGTTYLVEVQAVRATTLGMLVVGRSEMLSYTVPTASE
ncbi:MAG TPA: hypothetical protein VHQ42_01925 [Candidatus Limnocylindria bacterium]|nr:hypothetical protein [Candidatus Limnocylindria bacterium]